MSFTPQPRRIAVFLLFSSIAWLALPSDAADRDLAPTTPTEGGGAPEVTCGREFATIGIPGSDKLRIDPAGAENLGNEFGRFWAAANSAQANNFDGSCPSQNTEQVGGGWWETSQPPLRGIRGLIGEPGCVTSGCPEGSLTVLVEEQAEVEWDEPYFIALQVDPTPAELRWWDLSRVDPSPSPSVLTMHPFPHMAVTGTTRSGNTITVDFLFPEVAAGVHAVSGPGVDTPLPTSAIVKSYDLYHHVGISDPGRLAADWTLLEQFAYEDGPTEGTVELSCGWGAAEDEYVAVGLSFHGGDGPDVRSMLVGQAIQIECFGPQIGAAALGVLEYAPNPCTESGAEALVSTDPCHGGSALLGSVEVELEQHLCEMVFVEGLQLLPWPFFDCHSVEVFTLEPAAPDCLVQIRELTAGSEPGGLRIQWAALPCSDDYDVIRGNLDELGEGDLGAVLCVENDTVLLETLDTTGQDPDPGDGFFYLVRARGVVGSTHYGHTSAETTRVPTLGDCPLN